MKKLLLILTIGLISFGSALSLEPINITFKASPSYAANSTVDNVYITLSDKTGIKFTSQERDGVLVDDSGIITIKIGLFNGTEQTAWDNIDATSLNSFSVLEARIGGPTVAPFTQVRIDAQIINQTSTSVFINGNLVPQNPNSTLGTDNERFAGAYVLGSSVHIGPADGEALSKELEIGYQDSVGGPFEFGYGRITVNGTESARFFDDRLSLVGNSLVNVPLIDNAGGVTVNGTNNAAITLAGAVTANRAANVIGNGADATQLTISGINTPASPGPYVFELLVQGDAKVEGYLEINGLSLLGDLDLNNNDIFDVNEIRGRDPLQADPNTLRINTTNNGDVIIGDGAITVGTLGTADTTTFNGTVMMNEHVTLGNFVGDNIAVNGRVTTDLTPRVNNVNDLGNTSDRWNDLFLGGNASVGGNLLVNGTSNLQDSVDIDGPLNVDGNTTLNADVTLGDANTDNINVPGEFTSNLVPNTNNLNSLGTDAQRWSDVFVSGASVHIGDANGAANSDELAIRYNGSNVGSIAVGDGSSNANPQFTINATAEQLSLDPAADGQSNFVFSEGLMSVNTGAGTNLILNEDGFVKTAGVDTEFSFTNGGGAKLNVTIDGDLDVTEQITAPNSGHTFGTTGTDATVVTISGDVAGAAYELIVDGDADILGDAHIDQTLVVVGTIDGQTFGNTIGNSSDNTQLTINGDATGAAYDLVVTGDANITGDVEINETLQVDGTANVDGVFTATTFGNSIGDNSDNTQLTINGVVGGANDFIVTGDAQTTGSLDVDVNLNVDGTSQVDGTSNVDGIFTATAAGNSIGATTDATQLTINGVVGGANDFVVTGDAQTTGSLDVDANLNVDGNTQNDGTLNVDGIFSATADGNTIGNANNATKLTITGVAGGANELVVTGDIQATGNVDVDTDLNVDGNTVLNGNATLGSDNADNVAINGQVTTAIIPDADNTLDLGTSALRWNDINLGGNATVGNEGRFVTVGGTDYVGFKAPVAMANPGFNTVYTLPTAFPTSSGQALISNTTGTLSWGGVSLQSAYNAGNEINTDNGTVGNQDIVFTGTGERFDIRLNMVNTAAGAAVQVNDADGFTVNSGLTTANSGLTVGSAGLTTINGGVLIQTNDVDITSDVEITGTFVSDKKVTLGSGNATSTVQMVGVMHQTVGTAVGSLANIIILTNQVNLNVSSLNANFPEGSVVHIKFAGNGSGGTFTESSGNTTAISEDDGFIVVKSSGSWYIVGHFDN